MKKEIEDTIRQQPPFTGHHTVNHIAEDEKEAKKLGYKMMGGGDDSFLINISLEEIFQKMLKRFRIMYMPDIRDMMKGDDLLSTDEDLINKMLEVAKESAEEIYKEKLPKKIIELGSLNNSNG